MKTLTFFFSFLLIASTSFAKLSPVEKVAEDMKSYDVRTLYYEVENKDDNPCMSPGKSFQVELQVKKAIGFDPEKNEIIYDWETVKSVNVDKDGIVMEVCAE